MIILLNRTCKYQKLDFGRISNQLVDVTTAVLRKKASKMTQEQLKYLKRDAIVLVVSSPDGNNMTTAKSCEQAAFGSH